MKSSKTPKISVVMSCYNSEKYLDQAIESILNQSYGDFELLLLNDGSTDKTLSRFEYYSQLDNRCRVYSSENQGIVAMVNKGISLAKADIIFRMDGDDVSRPDRFEKQMNYLEAHPKCVAVGAKALLIDSDGLPIKEMWDITDHKKIDEFHLTGIGSAMCNPVTAIRKEAILKVGGYRQECNYAEDYDLWLRLAEIGQLANLPEVLVEYRQHVQSVGYKHREAQLKATKLAVDESKKRRGLLIDATEEVPEPLPSLSDIHLKWAWWALMANNRQTAKKHGFKAFLKSPFSLEIANFFYSLYVRPILKKPCFKNLTRSLKKLIN